ncbi:hypothetical protein RRF57_010987 [Xylaria bambusicola]|uniref:Uncharacterized protein n=1 Tax=Xylaria bambusicola TaxID=326684 RepID=A0AAN7UM19_9PEZI
MTINIITMRSHDNWQNKGIGNMSTTKVEMPLCGLFIQLYTRAAQIVFLIPITDGSSLRSIVADSEI